jgi:hypothetical protein
MRALTSAQIRAARSLIRWRADEYIGTATYFGAKPASEHTINLIDANGVTTTVSGALPEPSTWAMMTIGFLGQGSLRMSRCGLAGDTRHS